MRTLLFVATVAAILTACGGRVKVPDCGPLDYCSKTDVCCPHASVCGDGSDGCPWGACCPTPGPVPASTGGDPFAPAASAPTTASSSSGRVSGPAAQ